MLETSAMKLLGQELGGDAQVGWMTLLFVYFTEYYRLISCR
jgi:hypothetical protein